MKKTQDEKMRVSSLELPEDLWKRIAYRAIDEDRSIKKIAREAFEMYLKQPAKKDQR
jgi:hypothetical protein